MIRRAFVVGRPVWFVVLLLSALPGSAEKVAHYEDEVYGFRLSAPALGPDSGVPVVQRVLVFGPAQNGFAPNCGVQVQQAPMSLDEYMQLTARQMDAAGYEMLSRSRVRVSGLPAEKLRYKGNVGGNDLTFTALAVDRDDVILLLTCTALSTSADDFASDFEKVIESFEVQSVEDDEKDSE